MALSDYQQERRHFALKGSSFSVEGLSFEMLAILIKNHLTDLERLFELTAGVIGGKDSIEEGDLEKVAVVLAEEAPVFLANVIAMAAGESDEKAVAAARKLPFPVQVEVITAIAALTFEEVGGIKKFSETMKTLVGNVQKQQ